MFRDKEIIKKIDDVLLGHEEDFGHLCRRINELEKMIDDLQDTCSSINQIFDNFLESQRGDEQIKELIKDAMLEFKEEMEKPVKKAVRKK